MHFGQNDSDQPRLTATVGKQIQGTVEGNVAVALLFERDGGRALQWVDLAAGPGAAASFEIAPDEGGEWHLLQTGRSKPSEITAALLTIGRPVVLFLVSLRRIYALATDGFSPQLTDERVHRYRSLLWPVTRGYLTQLIAGRDWGDAPYDPYLLDALFRTPEDSDCGASSAVQARPHAHVRIEGSSFQGRCCGGVDLAVYCDTMPGSELCWVSGFDTTSDWTFDIYRSGDRWLSRSAHALREIPTGEPRPIFHEGRPAVVVYFDSNGWAYVLATSGVHVRAVEVDDLREGFAVAWRVPDGFLSSLIEGHNPGFFPADGWWLDYTGLSGFCPLDNTKVDISIAPSAG